jgi:hypothetical protein
MAGAAAAGDGGQLRDGLATAGGAGDLGGEGEQVGNPSRRPRDRGWDQPGDGGGGDRPDLGGSPSPGDIPQRRDDPGDLEQAEGCPGGELDAEGAPLQLVAAGAAGRRGLTSSPTRRLLGSGRVIERLAASDSFGAEPLECPPGIIPLVP